MMDRNPIAVGVPSDKTWNDFPGVNESTDAADVPLFRMMPFGCFKFVRLAEVQSKVAFEVPVNVIPAPEALTVVPPAPAVALKSRIPLLIILPSTTSK